MSRVDERTTEDTDDVYDCVHQLSPKTAKVIFYLILNNFAVCSLVINTADMIFL